MKVRKEKAEANEGNQEEEGTKHGGRLRKI